MTGATQVIQGDARDVLRTLPTASVHCVVTSPPYLGLRDYGLPASVWGGDPQCEHVWGSGGDCTCGAWLGVLGLEPSVALWTTHLVEIFREVARVLRPDGTLWLNCGDCYGGARSFAGRTEGTDGVFGRRNKRLGASGDGQEAPPVPAVPGRSKSLLGLAWRLAFALQADGWILRAEIIWAKGISFRPEWSGSVMPESVYDRPTRSHEQVFLFARQPRYFYDSEAVKEPVAASTQRDKRIRSTRLADYARGAADYGEGTSASRRLARSAVGNLSGRNLRSVWCIPVEPLKEPHFAAFPTALVEPCIKAGTSEHGVCAVCGAPWARITEKSRTFESGSANMPAGKNSTKQARMGRRHAGFNERWEREHMPLQGAGETLDVVTSRTVGWKPTCACDAGEPAPATVLDPFCGSGSAGVAAVRLDRGFIGIDLSEHYCEMARRRIGLADGTCLQDFRRMVRWCGPTVCDESWEEA